MADDDPIAGLGIPSAPAAQSTSKYIGVPDGTQIKKQVPQFSNPNFMGPQMPQSWTEADVTPRYEQGKQYSFGIGKSPADVLALQQQLVAAGLLDSYRRGVYDDQTAKAMEKLLGYANQTDMDADQALQRLAEQPLQDDKPAKPLEFSMPNRDDVKKLVTTTSKSVLGRNVDDATADRIAAAYEAETQRVQQANYEAQVAALANGSASFVTQDVKSQQAFAEDQIRAANPEEARAHDYANVYDQFSSMLAESSNAAQRNNSFGGL